MKIRPEQGNRELLELSKLEIELRNLRRPWYKAEFWKNIIYAVFVVITLYWAFTSDIFEIKNENLKFERNKLNSEIAKFTIEKDSIYYILTLTKDSLTDIRELLKNVMIGNMYRKIEVEKMGESLRKMGEFEKMAEYYKQKYDSLNFLIMKTQEIDKVLGTEDGRALMTEDGKLIKIKVK
jgi:hypothetical protein